METRDMLGATLIRVAEPIVVDMTIEQLFELQMELGQPLNIVDGTVEVDPTI